MRRALLPAFTVGLGLVAAACSSPAPDSTTKPVAACDAVDYSKFDGTKPTVSFRNDVLPIQIRACGFSSCHMHVLKPKAALTLAPNKPPAAPPADDICLDGATDDPCVALIISSMLEDSKTAPTVKRVAPGDPEHSFLMLKLDGCEEEAGLTCAVQSGAQSNNTCGDTMPRTGEQLSRAERDIYRRWIAQGAKNN